MSHPDLTAIGSFHTMKEFIFFTIANNLPRLSLLDKYRYFFYKLAGMKIKGKCTIWGPLTIRPIGCVKNIEIGEGSSLNTETRFGVPQSKVIIGRKVQIGPRVMFETVNHGLEYINDKGRGAWTKKL